MSIFRQDYRELTEAEKGAIVQIKDTTEDLWQLFGTAGSSREIAIAKTKLEEAVMWAVKGLTK